MVVQLSRFEGPLGLLLHLIKKEEMDIYDIEIHKITAQYLDYIRRMRELDLEIAGEFIAMAATLIHIKSQMLLPQYNEQGEEIENVDPRKDLVKRLIEYQMYKEASVKLYERPLLGRDWWRSDLPPVMDEDPDSEAAILLDDDNALFCLISGYRRVVKKIGKNIHRVTAGVQSVASRILELKNKLVIGSKTSLWNILPKEQWKDKILITFLSLLELSKLGYVSVYQVDLFGDIYIEPLKEIDEKVVLRSEEFDAPSKLNLFPDVEMPQLDADHDRGLYEEEPENVEAATDEEILAAEESLEKFDEPEQEGTFNV